MKINLIINFYFDSNAGRQYELDYCLNQNLRNTWIDRIIIFVSTQESVQIIGHLQKTYSTDKIFVTTRDERPSYNSFFDVTKHYADDINIIANTDIYFDESLRYVHFYARNSPAVNWCMALSRWDRQPNGELTHYNQPDSQDAWIFKHAIPEIPGADFTLGRAGCDNKIAYLLKEAGFEVFNPSQTIKAIHVHNTGIRHYNSRVDHLLIRPPFLTLHSQTL